MSFLFVFMLMIYYFCFVKGMSFLFVMGMLFPFVKGTPFLCVKGMSFLFVKGMPFLFVKGMSFHFVIILLGVCYLFFFLLRACHFFCLGYTISFC